QRVEDFFFDHLTLRERQITEQSRNGPLRLAARQEACRSGDGRRKAALRLGALDLIEAGFRPADDFQIPIVQDSLQMRDHRFAPIAEAFGRLLARLKRSIPKLTD